MKLAIVTLLGTAIAGPALAAGPMPANGQTYTEQQIQNTVSTPSGATVDTRRVGQGNQSTLDRPAPYDPRVHSRPAMNSFPPAPASPSPSPTAVPASPPR